MEKNYRKIIGWAAFIPRLLVMIASSVSLYHAFSVNSIVGIIAGILLTVTYLVDVLYLSVVLIHDIFVTKDDSWSRKTDKDMDEFVECEREIFDLYDDEKKE